MNLFFDTETTGMARHRDAADHPLQPRIVQLGAILFDDSRHIVAEINFLVKPDGWTIPTEATAVHGITTEQCERYGLKISTVMGLFCQIVRRAKLLTAHNFPFDKIVTWSELLRLQRADDLAAFLGIDNYCTMAASTPILKLPGRYGDYKWPNLREAYRHFTGKELEGAHDAMADVRGCAEVYWGLNPLPVAPTAPSTPNEEILD